MAAVRVELHIPTARSLKDKRAVIKPILEGVRHRFEVAAAEVGFQDKWQRAELGVAVVSGSASHATEVLDSVERWMWNRAEAEVCGFEVTWLDEDGTADAQA